MGIIQDTTDASGRYVKGSAKILKANASDKNKVASAYMPVGDEREAINSILKDFRLSWQTMHLPRPEFNDMSLYQRHIIDMLAFNTYQENDGNPMMEDRLGGWKSTAMRPIQRNKAVSIAAHETARITVPKIFAYNEQNEEQTDSAKVMSYLVDWAREQANYQHEALFRVMASLYSPISWGFTEYTEVYRKVKDSKNADGTWNYTDMLDDTESGFKHIPIPTDQVFFPNFYERDPQKQDSIILRRIISFDRAKTKYGHLPNFQFVEPGIIITMDDANQGFYRVYDPHMQGEDVEEITRWRKNGSDAWDIDTKLTMINGVLLDPADNPNPRIDHQYPFDAFYYLPINERCIAGKSLVFALGPETALINSQYQMMNDGAFLNLYPPTITTGSDKVGMDVIVPGLNLAFSDTDVEINPMRTADSDSLETMMKVSELVETSINQSSQDPVQQGQNPGTPSTAYEISRIEQNAATVLGLSMKFIAQHAINYGRLLVSDILQYQTIAQVSELTDTGLVYKTFFAKEPGQTGKMNKIQFDGNLPDTMTDDEKDQMSFELLKEQGGIKTDMKLWKVNPSMFREYRYKFTVDEDVLNPRSADLERAMDLETYDRAIANPVADQEQIFKDLLMSTNPKTASDPDKYVTPPPPPQQQAAQQMAQQQVPGMPPNGPTPLGNTVTPNQPNKPIPSSLGKLPQQMS
jgi:hypothetical protein